MANNTSVTSQGLAATDWCTLHLLRLNGSLGSSRCRASAAFGRPTQSKVTARMMSYRFWRTCITLQLTKPQRRARRSSVTMRNTNSCEVQSDEIEAPNPNWIGSFAPRWTLKPLGVCQCVRLPKTAQRIKKSHVRLTDMGNKSGNNLLSHCWVLSSALGA